MNTEDTTCAPKLVIDGTKVDFLDTELSEHRGAHDAGLDGDVQDALFDNLAVNTRSRVQFLAVGVDVTVAWVDVTPLFVGVSFEGWLVRLLAAGTLVLCFLVGFLGLLWLNIQLRGVGK